LKTPTKDEIQQIMDRKKVNDKIDLTVATAKKHGQPRFDVKVLDEVFRPYCHALEYEQTHGGDSDDVLDAVASLIANMATEFITRVVTRDDPQQAFSLAQTTTNKMAEYLSRGVMLNYGQDPLSPDAKSGNMGGN
jgi:hypothetical protein